MRKVLRYLSPGERLMAAVTILLTCLQVWLNLKLPACMTKITELLETKQASLKAIIQQGGWMLGYAIGGVIVAGLIGYFAAKTAAGLAKTLRQKVFNHVLDFSMAEVDHFSTASLINRTTNDVTQVQNLVNMALQAIIRAPIMAVWAAWMIRGEAWQWTTIVWVASGLLCLVLLLTLKIAFPRFKLVQGLTDRLNRITREHLTGIRVVRAYNAEKYQEDKFASANDELTQTNLIANRVMALMSPSIQLIDSGLTLAVYWIGAYLIEAAASGAKVTMFSNMVVFSNYAMQIVMAFMMLNMIFILLPRAQVSANRINEVLETAVDLKDGAGVSDEKADGTVEFDHVSFKYPNSELILKDLSFKVTAGQTLAIVGGTGSGKTTLLNLIPRLYDVTSGQIKIDGHDVKEYSQKALHAKIGFATQRAVMFGGTVASNVSYGSDQADQKQVLQAVNAAQADDFVLQMPEREQSPIAQGGTNVSGGQKQRLSIARALYRHPEILMFDDSFSALDFETDHALRQTLHQRFPQTTKIIVAQRLTTIMDADQIIVLEHGRIVGQGKHAELLKNCPTYQKIAASQLSKEELANESTKANE